MAGIKCEICGGSDLIKRDDLFVCQRCGTKYSVEDARKLFVDDSDSQFDQPVDHIKRTVSDLENEITRDLSDTAEESVAEAPAMKEQEPVADDAWEDGYGELESAPEAPEMAVLL